MKILCPKHKIFSEECILCKTDGVRIPIMEVVDPERLRRIREYNAEKQQERLITEVQNKIKNKI